MTTLTASRLATMPRVNLLPPEIAEQARFRKVQMGLGGAVLAALLVVGVLYFLAMGQVSSAEEDLATEKAEGAKLQKQEATYAQVPQVYEQVTTQEAKLAQAMGQEIRWSYLLNDLSLTMPSRVWLEQLAITQTVDSAAGAATAVQPILAGGLGQVQFDGRAFSHSDVAAWLDVLAKQKGYANAYFTNSQLQAPDASSVKQLVSFKSTVTLTDGARSRRYTQKAAG